MKTITLLLGLFASTFAFAASRVHTYKCYSYDWNGYTQESGTMNLSVSHELASAQIIYEGEVWQDKLGGNRNLNYRSRGRIEMYKYGSLVVEKSLTAGGRLLNDGRRGGFARWEGRADGGFFQYKFICKK